MMSTPLHILSAAELSFEEYLEILNQANKKLKEILTKHNCKDAADKLQVLDDKTVSDLKAKIGELDQLNTINKSLIEALLAAIPNSQSIAVNELKKSLNEAYKSFLQAQNKLINDKVYFKSAENLSLADSNSKIYLLRAVYKIVGLYSLTLELFSKLINHLPYTVRDSLLKANKQQIKDFLIQLQENIQVVRSYYRDILRQQKTLGKLEVIYETIKREHLKIVRSHIEPLTNELEQVAKELSVKIDVVVDNLNEILGGESVRNYEEYLEKLANQLVQLNTSLQNLWHKYVIPLTDYLQIAEYLESTISIGLWNQLNGNLSSADKLNQLAQALKGNADDFIASFNRVVGHNLQNKLRAKFYSCLSVFIHLLNSIKSSTSQLQNIQQQINACGSILNVHGELIIQLSKLHELISKLLPILKDIVDNPTEYADIFSLLGPTFIAKLNQLVIVLADSSQKLYQYAISGELSKYRQQLKVIYNILQTADTVKQLNGSLKDSRLVEPLIVLAGTIVSSSNTNKLKAVYQQLKSVISNSNVLNSLQNNLSAALRYYKQLKSLWLFVHLYYPLIKDVKATVAEITNYLQSVANKRDKYTQQVQLFKRYLTARANLKSIKASLLQAVDSFKNKYPTSQDILDLPADIKQARNLLQAVQKDLKSFLNTVDNVFCQSCSVDSIAARVANVMHDYSRYRAEPYLLYLALQLDTKGGLYKFIDQLHKQFNIDCKDSLASTDILGELNLKYPLTDFFSKHLPYMYKLLQVYVGTLEFVTDDRFQKAKQLMQKIPAKVNKLRQLENLKDNWLTEVQQITSYTELLQISEQLVNQYQIDIRQAIVELPYHLQIAEAANSLSRVIDKLELVQLSNSCKEELFNAFKLLPVFNVDTTVDLINWINLLQIVNLYKDEFAEYYKLSSLAPDIAQKALNTAFRNLLVNVETIGEAIKTSADSLQSLLYAKNSQLVTSAELTEYLAELYDLINQAATVLNSVGELIDSDTYKQFVANYNADGASYNIYQLLALLQELSSVIDSIYNLQNMFSDTIVQVGDIDEFISSISTTIGYLQSMQATISILLYISSLIQSIADYFELSVPSTTDGYIFIKYSSELHSLFAQLAKLQTILRDASASISSADK